MPGWTRYVRCICGEYLATYLNVPDLVLLLPIRTCHDLTHAQSPSAGRTSKLRRLSPKPVRCAIERHVSEPLLCCLLCLHHLMTWVSERRCRLDDLRSVSRPSMALLAVACLCPCMCPCVEYSIFYRTMQRYIKRVRILDLHPISSQASRYLSDKASIKTLFQPTNHSSIPSELPFKHPRQQPPR